VVRKTIVLLFLIATGVLLFVTQFLAKTVDGARVLGAQNISANLFSLNGIILVVIFVFYVIGLLRHYQELKG
jgi:hypothetical protein